MSTAVASRLTPQEYLIAERKAETKHEYDGGVVREMPGASLIHGLIAMNLAREAGVQLKGGPCEIFMSDLRTAIEEADLYTYPDLVIVCGEPRLIDSTFDTLLNPTVIVEVLSPSTEGYDRGRKFALYRASATLREYVLVAQEEMRVEQYERQGEKWVLTELTRPDEVLRLTSVDVAVPLGEIYGRVTFPSREARADP